MPPGRLIRPYLVGLSYEDRLLWSERWKQRRRRRPAEDLGPDVSADFVRFLVNLFKTK